MEAFQAEEVEFKDMPDEEEMQGYQQNVSINITHMTAVKTVTRIIRMVDDTEKTLIEVREKTFQL